MISESSQFNKKSRIYEFGEFQLEAENLLLLRNGEIVQLPIKAVQILLALVEANGRVMKKEEILERVWADTFIEESNLSHHVAALRRALGEEKNSKKFIETIPRRGYRFVADVREITESDGASEITVSERTTPRFIEQEIADDADGLESAKIRLIPDEEKQNATAPVLSSKIKFLVRRRLPLAVALVLIFGAVIFAVRNYFSGDKANHKTTAAAPFQTFKFKRLIGETLRATISADGKFIAYRDVRNALWLKNAATGGAVKILPESETIGRNAIAISPDNNHIYFGNVYGRGKKSEILKMSIFGGVPQVIAQDPWSYATLSPDGKYFSYTRGNNETGESFLLVAPTDGAGERAIARRELGRWFGNWSQATTWSPDGSRIACVTGGSNNKSTIITIVRVADGEQILLPEIDGNLWLDDLLWLPDGDNLLATVYDLSSGAQIYRYTISTNELRRVTNDLISYIGLSVTADGKTVVTSQVDDNCNLWVLPSDGNAGQARQITTGRNFINDAAGVSWTPDGRIIYATNASGRWEIWQTGTDGSNQKPLTQHCAGNDRCARPFASPDGHFIVFHATRDNIANIWRMDADGGNPTQLTFDDGSSPIVTPDGRFVIYTHTPPKGFATLRQIPIEGGEPKRLLKEMYSVYLASLSPDGKLLAFNYSKEIEKRRWQTCVASIDADTDAPEKCFGISRSFPLWAADGKAFFYLDHGYAGIWKQPLEGERTMFLQFPGEQVNNFAFSADGKQLVVSRSKPTIDAIALTDEP